MQSQLGRSTFLFTIQLMALYSRRSTQLLPNSVLSSVRRRIHLVHHTYKIRKLHLLVRSTLEIINWCLKDMTPLISFNSAIQKFTLEVLYFLFLNHLFPSCKKSIWFILFYTYLSNRSFPFLIILCYFLS